MKKIILGFVATCTIVIIAVIVWVYSSLDHLVKTAIEKYGSLYTQVSVKLDKAQLLPRQGQGTLYGLFISNPQSFKTAHLLKVGKISLDLNVASVTEDVVRINKLEIIAPHIIYETGAQGSNLDAIQRNLKRSMKTHDSTTEQESSSKRMIIERLIISDAKVSYSQTLLPGKEVDFSLPNITLSNIGKNQGGVSASKVAQTVATALQSSITTNLVKKINPNDLLNKAKDLDLKKLDPRKLFKSE